jgi:hypothetical protein
MLGHLSLPTTFRDLRWFEGSLCADTRDPIHSKLPRQASPESTLEALARPLLYVGDVLACSPLAFSLKTRDSLAPNSLRPGIIKLKHRLISDSSFLDVTQFFIGPRLSAHFIQSCGDDLAEYEYLESFVAQPLNARNVALFRVPAMTGSEASTELRAFPLSKNYYLSNPTLKIRLLIKPRRNPTQVSFKGFPLFGEEIALIHAVPFDTPS